MTVCYTYCFGAVVWTAVLLVTAACVCVFSSHLFWTSSSLDVPAGVKHKEGHTGFPIHFPSAVGCCCCCCCLHIKNRFDLYSVRSNIRTGPTDANAFRDHRLTTQKGTYYEKSKRNKRPRKVNTHAIIGSFLFCFLNKAPDS